MKKKELKKLKRALAAGIFCLIMFVCALIVFTASSVVTDYEIVKTDELDVSQLSSKLDKGTILQFDDLMIIDEYASYTESYYGLFKKSENRYYLAVFNDANKKPCYVSVAVDIEKDVFKQLDGYVNDSNSFVGDLMLPVCAVEGSIDDNDLVTYYQDCINLYDEQLKTYLGGSSKSTITDSKLKLNYAFDTVNNIDEYKASERKEYIITYAIFGICLLVFLCSIISVVRKMKKLKNTPDDEYELNNIGTQQYTSTEQSTQTDEYYNPQQSQYFNSDNTEQ